MGRGNSVRRTLAIFEATMGKPLALREVRRGTGLVAAIGRWQHDGARVPLVQASTTQLVLNITGGQGLEWPEAGRTVASRAVAGRVAVVSPGGFPEIRIFGPAGTMQLVLDETLIEPVSAAPPRQRRDSLQALAAQALAALLCGPADDVVQAMVMRAAQMVAEPAPAVRPPARGGLSPAARARVRACLDAQLGCEPYRLPSVRVLADAAGVSLHHFIRAFHASAGETPHAWVTARQIDFSLRLLLGQRCRVDEVADRAGFSSPAHFVSTFRRRIGVTPGVVRAAATVNAAIS